MSRDMRRDDRQEATIATIAELVKFIQEVDNPCVGFVGPFGEGSAA